MTASIPRIDEYDYYLIVWSPGNVHSPMAFQKGVHPEDYCDEIIAKAQDARLHKRPNASSFDGYQIFRMEVIPD